MGSAADPSTSLTLLGVLCSAARNDTAWRTFQTRYRPLIYRCCCGRDLQAADAEDVTQKVLLKLFTRIGTYRPERGGFRTWLKSVVRNAVLDFRRQQKRHPADRGSGDSAVQEFLHGVEDPDTLDASVEELDRQVVSDMGRVMARVRAQVQPDTWELFVRTVLEGQPRERVAAELGKTYVAACMAVKRVRDRLRTEWGRLRA
jgi:RNA polymerase sigma-70 factor (ECF subfamily)